MEKSDSENDSDCYESAEEEIEINEKVLNKKSSSVKTISESESDVFSSVNTFDEAENTVVDVPRKEASKNTMSYRKRPERVRRLDSIASLKKEALKRELSTPDAFLQDITTNFSKNLNKGLSTIQQTSSSVKELIMNSLPGTTLTENSSFSYDDNDNLPIGVDADGELCSLSQSELILNELSQCLAERKRECGQNNKKFPEDEINIPSTNSELDAKVEEVNCERLASNESTTSNFIEKLKDDSYIVSDGMKKKPAERYKGEIHEIYSRLPLTESNLVSNELKSDILEKEIVYDKNQSGGDELLNETSSHIVKIIVCKDIDLNEDEFSRSSTNSFQLSKDPETISGALKTSTSKTMSKEENKDTCVITYPNENETDDWNDSFQNTTTTVIVDSWIKGDWDDFDAESVENTTEILESDLEALRTGLKNIVLDTDDESSKDEVKKSEETSIAESIEATQATQGGWDDFDFSDHEIENVDVEPKVSENLIPVLTAQAKEDKKPCTDQMSEPKKIAKQEEEEKRLERNIIKEKRDKEDEGKSQTKSRRNVLGAKKLGKPTTEKVSKPEVKESKPADNDNWDWDNWDDDEETKTEEKESSRKEEGNEINEFEKKWSGWDTFAQKQDEREANWNLGSWGVNMLLNKATAVTQGISTVLEAGLGAPDPETLARMEREEKIKRPDGNNKGNEESPRKDSNDAMMFPVFELTNLVAGVTSKIVDPSKIQEIGSKVISGGLDTLESFGKKTMEVLQEGDPGLKKKRALLLGSDKPVLSQILKEAKEKAEREDRRIEEKELFRKCQFETLFDDYQGMIHLEALEMLSTQCELKLDQIRSSLNQAEQEDMDGILQEVEQLCCLEDFYLDWDNFSNSNFKVSIGLAVESVKEEISLVKILQIHGQVEDWLSDASGSRPSGVVVHQKVVSTLAELTAATVHQFHKTGELLSVKECRKTVEEVDALIKMTNVLCAELERLCGRFKALCEKMPEKDSICHKIDIVLNNSVSYIKQAFNLLVPIIQIGAAL